ncbi:hypothetical protein HYN56_04465 [Flavobacterium crocinum]|uniref:DUF3592 domain-containing protein n=1 Tax=Flavobacterium crocinum TaxID=2183896 RepID=A0A2S1YHH6_9FLAO|nr:DUF3592 domain-containing protein [Flavobacterium crocinum]AWK03514.1 hypothetical protein HYN56_04465 [Flavobacterium crocinum]
MQSKAAKIIFLVLVALAGVGAFWMYKFGPETFTHNETRKKYETYIQAEGTIVTKELRGSAIKKNTIWVVQFKDKDDKLQTVKIFDNTTMGKETGEKIIVYYNPTDPTECIDEQEYNDTM